MDKIKLIMSRDLKFEAENSMKNTGGIRQEWPISYLDFAFLGVIHVQMFLAASY